MSRSASLRASDVRAVFHLVGECRELGDDPARWRAHLAAGLARLAGAGVVNVGESTAGRAAPHRSLGYISWGWENGFDRSYWERIATEFVRRGPDFSPFYTAYMAAFAREDGASLTRADLVPDTTWERSDYFPLHRGAGAGPILFNYRSLPGRPDECSEVVLVRAVGDRDFSARDKVLVQEANAAVVPLVGGSLARFAEPSPADLPPFTRKVLRCLLEGDSDKQVMARLGITRHTVNQYAKVIFRHFGVQSRAELLARWVRRGWGGRFSWAD